MPPKPIDAHQRLSAFRDRYKSDREAAAVLGITKQYLGGMLRQRLPISDRILKSLGLKRVTIIREI